MPGSFDFSNKAKYSPSECGTSVNVDNALDFQVGSLFAAFLDFFLLSETFCLILARRAVEPRLLVSGREEGS